MRKLAIIIMIIFGLLLLSANSQLTTDSAASQTSTDEADDENHESDGEAHETDVDESSDGQADDEHKKEESHSSIPGVGLSIVFIFGGLLYGGMLKLVSRITNIPYNPLLLLSGIFLGMNYASLGIVGKSIELIVQVSPNGILAMFLPCLIFQSAFKTEWHIFKKLAGQSLILGILSSIVCASLIMVAIKLFVDHNNHYEWHEAFLLGSLLTCTDIFSFVTKLKRNGTPQKITSLIEGESLFNYCTCVLIFQFFEYFVGVKEEITIWDYLRLFFEETVGGIVFGVVFGFISVYCIKRMIYDGILAVAIMVIFCYSIYLIAEFSVLRVSGIISIVVYALYMNAFGKTWLFGETQEYVEGFWDYLVFVAQTNIFLIAGTMVGANILTFQGINHEDEYIIVIYIYIIALIARFLSIGVFIKYLRKIGEGIKWREIVVITFAGLKGAIGIALAMLVYKNHHYGHQVGSLILLHVTCNSLMTLIINGLSTGAIVKITGLSTLKKVEYKFFHQYLMSFQAVVLEKKLELQGEKSGSQYEMIDWQAVDKNVGNDDIREMKEKIQSLILADNFNEDSKFQKSQMYKLEQVLKHTESRENNIKQKTAKFDLEVEFRKRFLKDLIAKYWEYQERNYTTPAALMLLIQSAISDLDKETQEIESWYWIKNEISFNMRIFSEFMKLTFVNELAKTHLFEYVSFCYDVVSSYIEANQEIRKELHDFYMKNNQDLTKLREEKVILQNVLRESQENQKQAEFFLTNYLEPSFPEIEKEVKTRKVSFYVLHSFKKIIDKNNETGQLEPNEFDMLNDIIGQKSLELNLYSPKWKKTEFIEILQRNEFFGCLPLPVLHLLANQLTQESNFDANERIMDNAEIAKHVYFVKKGGCIVQFSNDSLVYKEPMLSGQIFGFQSLVTNIYHSKATTNTMAQIVSVKKACISKIFQTFEKVEEQFWKKHIFQCYKMFVKKDDITSTIGHLSKEEINDLIENFSIETLQPGEYEVTKDMIFIRGGFQILEESEIPSTPFYFLNKDDEDVIKVRETSVFLVGLLDYQILERSTMRMSKNSKLKRKLATS